jgi:deoxyribonuclease V
VGAVAVLDYENLKVVETQIAIQKVKLPYVPTLFAFRELPAAIASIRKLKVQPDVLLVDGHGKAHPFGCGLACHLGVALNKPTIGVAKSWLVGEPEKVGRDIFLVHDGEVVGALVTTHEGAKPVYVSVGHMVSLQTAVKIVEHCSRQSRIPQPIREAHRIASEERKAKIALMH